MNYDLLAALAPLLLLIYLMTRRRAVPSYRALPLAAFVLYGMKLIYFREDANLINATVLNGLLTALTPILIVWGAVFLFKTMDYSGDMEVIRRWLNGVSQNRVAQLMIIGWAFAFMIEGASGFGTPAALAAPILVGLGFPAVRVAMLCLVMNSVPVSFGAVGTPTWFGFSELDLTSAELLSVGFKTALVHGMAALVIPPLALLFVVPAREVKRNLVFVYLSILGCVAPLLIVARFDYEFPSLLGGAVGLGFSVYLAHRGIGLARDQGEEGRVTIPSRQLVKALFPLWGTIVILLLTRIRQLGLKGFLNAASPSLDLPLGSLGDLSISPSLVVSLTDIFGAASAWSHKFLYVPSIIPFFLVSFITFRVAGVKRETRRRIWDDSLDRMKRPILALLGALVFVKLLLVGGDQACTVIISQAAASLAGDKWPYVAAYLGALGGFFAGSNTVSNLTFGGIQAGIAENLGIEQTVILALQSVGGAMGNMVCIHNIVAVCSILDILSEEGRILKKTFVPMLLYGLVAALGAALLLR